MTPARALAWLERRGWSIQCHGDDPGSFFVTATHPGPNTAHDWIQLNGAYAESHDASILALVAALRPPRREPSGEWRKDGPQSWLLQLSHTSCWVDRGAHGWQWCVVLTGDYDHRPTRRLAQLAAERAARRAEKVRAR